MLVKELFEQGGEFEILEQSARKFVTSAKIGKRSIIFTASLVAGSWDIEFAEHGSKKSYDLTGSGDEIKVFAMVKASIAKLIELYHPKEISFMTDGDGGGARDKRADVYEKMFKRAKVPGYTFSRVSFGDELDLTDPNFEETIGKTLFKLTKN